MKNYKIGKIKNRMIPEKPQAVRAKRGRMERSRQVKPIGGIPGQCADLAANATNPVKREASKLHDRKLQRSKKSAGEFDGSVIQY
jgi:hypothetical protein